MIKCECGSFFKTACAHAEHKVQTGKPDEHRLGCSSCFIVLGTLQPDFKGVIVQNRGVTKFIYCEECGKLLMNLIDEE